MSGSPAATCRAFAVLVPLALLAGCLSHVLPDPGPPPATYDFGPAPEEPPAPLPLPFRLDSVTAPSWLRTPSIYYRRLDEHRAELRPYALNQWIAPATELFAERLTDRLARAGPGTFATRLPLDVEIVTFEHVYTAPNEAYVVARVRAAYEGLDGRVRRREFERRRSAAAEVGGATEALPLVADALVDDVLDWLRGETLDR